VTDQPIRNLRGFEKDRFNAGESKTLSFPLRAKDLAVYDVVRAAWTIPSGEYTFSLGPDSRNLPVTVTLQVSLFFCWSVCKRQS
jgi:beta-glucosidase